MKQKVVKKIKYTNSPSPNTAWQRVYPFIYQVKPFCLISFSPTTPFQATTKVCPQSPAPSPNMPSALSPSLSTSPICPELEAASPENPFFYYYSAEDARCIALNVSCPENVNQLYDLMALLIPAKCAHFQNELQYSIAKGKRATLNDEVLCFVFIFSSLMCSGQLKIRSLSLCQGHHHHNS